MKGSSERVRHTLERLGVDGSGMVVAVSGGPDSVALLHILLRLRCEKPAPLVIAHLNHQLRGAEADADEEFVRRLHSELIAAGHEALSLCSKRIDIAGQAAASRSNTEATAREERYRFFVDVAREHGLKLVATGHTADDQAETVLHRMLRGTGLQGLRGIAEKRPLAEGIELVRPLLGLTRAQVLKFLEDEGLSARQDSTNADLKYTRNRIRHELLPYLARHFNPAIREVLGRLAAQAAEAFEAEQASVLALLQEAELPRAGLRIVLGREKLLLASRRLVRHLFRHLWTREGWPTGRMTSAHWRRLEAIVFDDLTAADFPEGMHAHCRDKIILLGPSAERH
jgi:tRNA(Ile)-lysidine synthase